METKNKIAFAIGLLTIAMVATSLVVSTEDAQAWKKGKYSSGYTQNNLQKCTDDAGCAQGNQQNEEGNNYQGDIGFK